MILFCLETSKVFVNPIKSQTTPDITRDIAIITKVLDAIKTSFNNSDMNIFNMKVQIMKSTLL